MSQTEILAMILTIQTAMSVILPHLGIAGVSNTIAGWASASNPDWYNFLIWCWNAISFAFQMTTFQVAGLEALSVIWNIASLIVGWIIVSLVRGTNS